MTADQVQILDVQAIKARIRRIAFEIYENHFLEKEIVVIGVGRRGGYVAEMIGKDLSTISPLEVLQITAHLDRSDPDGLLGIELSAELDDLKNKVIIVVDDVLYTGNTLLNVVAILLQVVPKSIQTAILIDRGGHRKMPVAPDYVGLELATTLQQHVSVDIDSEEMAVYLD